MPEEAKSMLVARFLEEKKMPPLLNISVYIGEQVPILRLSGYEVRRDARGIKDSLKLLSEPGGI